MALSFSAYLYGAGLVTAGAMADGVLVQTSNSGHQPPLPPR